MKQGSKRRWMGVSEGFVSTGSSGLSGLLISARSGTSLIYGQSYRIWTVPVVALLLFCSVILSLAMAGLPNHAYSETIVLPKTGQTTTFAAGDDGDLERGVAWHSPRFTNNGNGTMTDELTGLIWLRNAACFSQRIWTQTISDANTLANGQCGLTDGSRAGDWRLSNINELESLVHAGQANPVEWLNASGFSNVQSHYWSSTTYSGNTSYAWAVHIQSGNVYANINKSTHFSAWPVRGTTTTPAQLWKTGQVTRYATGDDGDLKKGAAWPSPRFTAGTGAEANCVTDNLTGIMLVKSPDSTIRTWSEAITYANDFNPCGHNDWRLPNRKELRSLIDYSQYLPALPLGYNSYFTNVRSDGYWLSTTYAGDTDYAWYIDLWDGGMYARPKSNGLYVWIVRAGQFYNLAITKAGTGTGAVTSNPQKINCGSTCSANFVEDTEVTLTATAGIGSTFAGWSGDCSGTNTTTVVIMNSDKSCTATFNISIIFTISGKVTTGGSGVGVGSSTPISGVTMTLSGLTPGTTTTDGNGNYTFSGLANGAYTVAPSLAGYAFIPASRGVNINNANVTGQNFTGTITRGTPTFSISGAITSGGNPLAGVTVVLTGAANVTVTTNASGVYAFTGLANGNYTVTPSLAGFTFAPLNRAVTINNANITGQNFVGTDATSVYLISGIVRDRGLGAGGSPVSGVTITLGGSASNTTTTDGNGNYSFTGLSNGNYTVTPSQAGRTFTPANRAVTINNANVAGQNFTRN